VSPEPASCGSAAEQCGEARPNRRTSSKTLRVEARPRCDESNERATERQSLSAQSGGKAATNLVAGLVVLMAFLCVGFLMPVAGLGQVPAQSRNAEIATIAVYAKQVDRFIKRNDKRRRTFGNVGDEQDHWKEFKGKPAKGETDPDDLNEVAYVWARKGKVVAAGFTFQSDSRDWAHYVTYYFRADGTLAKIHAQLNTFYGDISVVRNKFYNSNGKLLRTSTRYLDLQSKKSRKRGDFQDEPIPVYRTVRSLPFYRIL